ncbi:MAG: BamA/TamA family outer membrane protein [Deltaproteobacteria bacterium]|nr:BamA/TamA family outer membrane protein [Deltaproteobacteria bacterium]MDQ3301525.1 BamA/TamA family outer membrane protein [Myxococcota bacterium]
MIRPSLVVIITLVASAGQATAAPDVADPPPPADQGPETTPDLTPPPAPQPAPPPPPAASAAVAGTEHLTTETYDRDQPIDLHWHILNVPGYLLEIVVMPITLAVEYTERHYIHRRVADLLSFYDGKIKISPRFKLAFGDGLGVGAAIKFPKLLSRSAKLSFGGMYRLNRDWKLDADYLQRIGFIERRALHIDGFAEHDGNARYYGIGGDTPEADRRAMLDDEQALVVGLDVFARDTYDWSGIVELGVFRQHLGPGIEPMLKPGEVPHEPLGSPGDHVELPPGFNDTSVLGHLGLGLRYDTRDTKGRPTKGSIVDGKLKARSDVAGALSGVKFEFSTQLFLSVLPDARLFVVTVGGSAAVPIFTDSEIPLNTLSILGREHRLRGYDRGRFRDYYAGWVNVEYRYPIYEYLTTGAGLDAFLFTDVASAFGEDKLTAKRVRYSTGVGFRGAHETRLVFESFVGWSPEGFQFVIGAEQKL